jgi:hypothetical protein
MKRAALLIAGVIAGCAATNANVREVTSNPQTGLTVRVRGGVGQHAHPAAVPDRDVRSALLSEGFFVENDVAVLVPAIVAELKQLHPDEVLSLESTGSVRQVFVDGGKLFIVNVDGGEERSRTAWTIGDSGPAPVSPAARISAAPPPVEAAPAMRNPVHAAGQPQNLALVIGVESYRDLPRVENARDDAKRVRDYLHDVVDLPDDHIIMLTDDKASLTDINKYVDAWLPRMARGANRLYFYFAGHGSPDVNTGAAHLVPWDGDPRFLKETAIDLGDLYRRLAQSGVREVVVMLDACFSGAGARSVLPKGARPLVRVQVPNTPPAPMVVLSAASASQIAGPVPGGGAGLFTHYLIEGLDGPADADGDGQITAAELIGYVKPRVAREAQKENRDQTPEIQTGHAAGDLVLVQGLRTK